MGVAPTALREQREAGRARPRLSRAAPAEGAARPPPPLLAGCFRPASAETAPAAAVPGAADGEGNPGLAGYYRTFIQALYCGLNQQYPVWVVSHAGHCKPPSGMEMIEDTDIKELEDVFGLNGQVEHKLNFLKKNVSKDIKLVLIAHSIGCYITLEMMKRASELQRNIEK
ncbi:lipid droplet-associated hydrolase-like isoform X4 [Empidonax traillii]|uniref:lipid droplet-associated hydrolase-like isoform X4 n=1 Tax=Empidonax traillii TaxID=164674 RepID=UPI000FFCEC3F|nr:lipid droplet-associated hydrolase-like isoform X4 [Empidonax traillii]